MYALRILFLLKVQKSSIPYKQLNAIKYNPYIFLNNEKQKRGSKEPFFFIEPLILHKLASVHISGLYPVLH